MKTKEMIETLRYKANNIKAKIEPEFFNEVAERLEKQVGKKTIKQSIDEKTHYKCVCGYIHMTVYKKDGFRLGRITKYCECCGQKVDESEVE